MLKYADYKVVFQEIPDEITLAINISGCPVGCPMCHSSYLSEDIGTELTESELMRLVKLNKGITCIALMGGDAEPQEVSNLLLGYKSYMAFCGTDERTLKVAWYSGRELLPNGYEFFDYIKLGPYRSEFGPLNNPHTNQRLYKINIVDDEPKLEDITYKFWIKNAE